MNRVAETTGMALQQSSMNIMKSIILIDNNKTLLQYRNIKISDTGSIKIKLFLL